MITFTRHNPTSQLYVADETNCDVIIAFYYLSSQPTFGSPGTQISLVDTWEKYNGYYLIVNTQASADDLDTNAVSIINGRSDTQTGFLWLRYDGTTFQPAGTIRNQRSDPPPENPPPLVTTTTEVSVDFGGYGLPFGAGTRIVYKDAAEPTGFVFEYPAAPAASRKYPADAVVPDPDPNANVFVLFTGALMGCFQGEAFIGDYYSAENTSWKMGLRFVVQYGNEEVSQFYPIFNLEVGTGPLLWMCWDPVNHLDTDRTCLTFPGGSIELVVDVGSTTPTCRKFIPERRPIPTYYRTVTGEIIGFYPVESGAQRSKLVFERCTAEGTPAASAKYYLVPCGAFELTLLHKDGTPLNVWDGEAENPSRFMCGLSGVESVPFMPTMPCCPGDSIVFVPDKPAFAQYYPVFGTGIAGAPGGNPSDLLHTKYRTAWASFSPTFNFSGSEYLSQPETGPLYALMRAPKPGGGHEILGLDEPVAHALPAPAADACFPVVPAAGALANGAFGARTATFVSEFEAQVLSPFRRETILRFFVPATPPTRPLPPGAPEDPPGAPWFIPELRWYFENWYDNACMADFFSIGQSTTPCGLIASITGNYWWRVLLAQSTTTGTVLQFCWLNTVLQAAFQTNQLFMVATNSQYLHYDGGTMFKSDVYLGDWSFDLDVSKSTFVATAGNPPPADFRDLNNTLILKFSPGRIIDRIKDTRAWTNPRDFNSAESAKLVRLSTRLKAFVDDALAKAAEQNPHPAYVRFKKIVEDENWRGVLSLNVLIDTDGLPSQLQFLAAGVDAPTFVAHHIALETGHVVCGPNGVIVPSEAAIDALIDYHQPPLNGPDPALTQPYYFAVKEFFAWFGNSALREFRCTADLTLNQIFDEPVASVTGGATNTIRILGNREVHNGTSVYSFVVDGERKFNMNSKVLDFVQVKKTQFVAAKQAGQPSDPLTIIATFAFFGYIKFRVPGAGFDVYSYERLAFENMALEMKYVKSTPTPTTTYTFTIARMTFDLSPGATQVRGESLVHKFPMRLNGLLQGGVLRPPGENPPGDPKAELPSKQGYVRVLANLDSDAMEWRWYGLDFELNLGTIGEMAANAGLTARLLLGWSPGGTTRAKAQIWLKFPGVSGANNDLFSIEGVVKLGASSYEITRSVNGTTASYLLKIKNFALRVLGVALPLGGGPDIFIFGNPNPPPEPNGAKDEALGWVGAYKRPTPP